MTLDKITELCKEKAANAAPLGNSIRFDLEGDHVMLDGKGDKNVVTNDGDDADCVVTIKKEHFYGLLTGEIQPMQAFMAGMFRVSGEMGVAMKLPALFG